MPVYIALASVTPQQQKKFEAWLLVRESDIANDIEDFGELLDIFVSVFDREPQSC